MNDDDLTTSLTRELHERADAVHGTALGLAHVTGRARSIRRRRAATAVVGAAAAVALIVPTAALANHHGNRTEPGPATQSPTPSPTQTTTTADGHQPPPGVLDVSDLPTGAAPQLPYVEDGSLHLADGTTAQVPTRYPVDSFVAMRDGSRVWQTNNDSVPFIEIEASDGTLLPPIRSDWGLAVNGAHTIAAWMTPDGRVHVFGPGDTEPATLGDPITDGYQRTVVAVTGTDCALACDVYVNVSAAGGARPVWEVSPSGSRRLLDGSFQGISDVTDSGLTIGFDSVTDNGSCSKLLGGGEFQGFRTCKVTLESFSPDGSTIMADPPYFDGLGPTALSMWNLEGKKLFERRADNKHQATVASARWEDARHLLTTIYQDGKWSIVRVGIDGSLEYAVPPVSGNDVDSPFVLPTGGAVPHA
jgi:hypothetical protein